MKGITIQYILIFSMILATTGAQAQESGSIQQKERFHLGINYTYFQTDMNLTRQSEHAIWQGLDYGVDTLSEDEINWINDAVKFQSRSNAICIEAGMNLVGNPDSKWYLGMRVLLGLEKTWYEARDKPSGNSDLSVRSDFNRPILGIGIMFRHVFNPHWDLALEPLATYSWGSTSDITDNLDLPVPVLEVDRKEQAKSLYSRITLLAGYRIRGFRISAGPGFYLVYNHRTYTINRTNPETGSTFLNEKTSTYWNHSFVDGSVRVSWRIIPLMEVYLAGGIGRDIYVHPGIRFFL